MSSNSPSNKLSPITQKTNLTLLTQIPITFKDQKANKQLLTQKTQRPENCGFAAAPSTECENAKFNNGRWNNAEHRAFIEGIFKYSNDWKRVVDEVKTRNCPQARSHSQKFFGKLNKYITKNNANYYVDLKKIFFFGKQVEKIVKENVVEMLSLAHDHLDNVLNCEMLNHNLLADFLWNVKKNKQVKDEIGGESATASAKKNSNINFGKGSNNNNFNRNLYHDDNCNNLILVSENNNKNDRNDNVLVNDFKNFDDVRINNNSSNSNNVNRNFFDDYVNIKNKDNNTNNNINNIVNHKLINVKLANESNINNSNNNNTIRKNFGKTLNSNFSLNNKDNTLSASENIGMTNNSSGNTTNQNFCNNEINNNKNNNNQSNNFSNSARNNVFNNFNININVTNFGNNFNLNNFASKKNNETSNKRSDCYSIEISNKTETTEENKIDVSKTTNQIYKNINSNINNIIHNQLKSDDVINISNINLNTINDNSTEEVKTRNSNRKEKGKKEEITEENESIVNYDFIVPQPIRKNFSNFIQINSEFAKTFSNEIEKDNFFRMQGFDTKTTFMTKENKIIFNNYENKRLNKIETFDSEKQADDPIEKISAYDYNNFYFNRCLEYLKKNSYKGKTDLIQEIKKCFIFPKKLLIENNNCTCCNCRSENSVKNADLHLEENNENKKCINNQYYYCEFDDVSFISNNEKHCYMNVKKDSNYDWNNI